jgi:uncharacterized protein YacL
MKTAGWEARLLFLVALGLVGTLAFDGLWMGLLGLAIGIVAILLEGLFIRLPANELVYIAVGATAGLVFGLLLVLVLRLGNVTLTSTEGGEDPMLLIPIALAYVMAHVSLVKGRKLGLLKRAEESFESTLSPLLIDLSAVVDGRIADMVLAGLFTGPFVLTASIKPSLEALAKSKDMVKRGRARRGTEVLERLEEAAVNTGGLEYRDFGDREREQFKILEWLRKERATLLSNDAKLLDIAEKEGNRVVRLDEVGPAAKQVVLPGEKLTLRLIRKGRNPGQGVGFLNDGTMVVVEESDSLIGKEVSATAHTTFRASGGTMVFSRMTKNIVPEADTQGDA